MIQSPKHIIVSRTDSIGDVVVSIPLCGKLKELFPNVKITFLGKSYTEAVIRASKYVDHFINWDEIEKTSPQEQIQAFQTLNADTIIHVFPRKEIVWLAKRAKIKNRIATGRRWYTLAKCNHPVFFSRRKSNLHEAQLNFKLLKPFAYNEVPSLQEIASLYGISAPEFLEKPAILKDVDLQKLIILHPLSKGSAVNWSLQEFAKLAQWLVQRGYPVAISGTKEEGDKLKLHQFDFSNGIIDLTGRLTLNDFIALISNAFALVAASTGPLHISAALNIHAIGLYSPLKPIDPSRWAPIGKNAKVFVASEHPENGELNISHLAIAEYILSLIKAN